MKKIVKNNVLFEWDEVTGVGKVIGTDVDASSALVREVMLKNPKKIHTVFAMGTRQDKVIALLRGPALTNYIKATPVSPTAPIMHHTSSAKKQCAGIVVFCIKTGRFLFAVRAQGVAAGGQLGLFGGHLEAGEFPEHAACREFREEGGLEVTPDKLSAELWTYDGPGLIYHNYLLVVSEEFECTLDTNEIAEYQWMTFKAFFNSKVVKVHGLMDLFMNDKILKKLIETHDSGASISYTQLIDDMVRDEVLTPVDDDGDDDGPGPLVA